MFKSQNLHSGYRRVFEFKANSSFSAEVKGNATVESDFAEELAASITAITAIASKDVTGFYRRPSSVSQMAKY